MDANDALDQLVRVSEDIGAAVVFERGGEPIAATVADDEAREVAALGDSMLAYADALRDAEVRQLEAVTADGGVYVVRSGGRAVVATAGPGALTGLVQHDLRMLLGSLSGPRSKAKAGAAS